MTLLGIDISHYQGRPNLAAFKAAGGAFVIAKATQGVNYVDPEFATSRADAAAAGLVFGSYGFPNWGDPVAEANYYLQHAAPKPGELVAFDAEGTVPAGVDVVAFSDVWSRTVKAAVGAPPLIYMNQSWLAGHNWAPVLADGDGLWLAKYDGLQVQSPSGIWDALSFKQFTSTGAEPGVAGNVDVDTFFGDLPTLQKFTIPSSGANTVALTPTDVELIWNRPVARADESTGGVLKQIPALQELADAKTKGLQNADALADLETRVANLQATVAQGTSITLDQAAAEMVAAAMVANPKFAEVVAGAAATVVSQMDADLAARFGPKA